ncbi:Holliday junction branch migration protein RuvA [Candidatus Gracilibacteria bacterium]|nr:Holliday junction branch migration protein RuvA [Candidatus Gracilibacteria bacterium]
MFSYVKGSVLYIEDSKVSVSVAGTGLGLEIFVSPITLSKIVVGEEIELFIHHHITEVSQTLFGFENLGEKKVFKSLLKIDGIGGKAAINILGIGIHNLVKAIEENDDKFLTTIPGIGKKTALKIILEMKNKVEAGDLFDRTENLKLSRPYDQDIIKTLTDMGYDKKKVEEIVKNIPEDITELKDKVMFAIKTLSK